MKRKRDVIVVGGGPAGAATATHLARSGFDVLLIDRESFPRAKPCGEFFSPPVRGLLSGLGVYEAALAAGIRTITDARIFCSAGSFSGSFSSHPHPWSAAGGFSIERRVLDHLLIQNAARCGASVQTGIACRGLLRDADGAVAGIRTDAGEIHARLVVGADGSRSRVARELNLLRSLPRLQKIALVSHFSDFPTPWQEAGPVCVEMHVGPRRLVCGVGPGPDGSANVTLVAPETEARRVAVQGAATYANATIAEHFPALSERCAVAKRRDIRTCGTSGHVTRSPVADGALLVGDAATFIDPFTGEGVYFALRGAEIAAEVIGGALHRGDTSARSLRSYVWQRRRELAPKYAVCDMVERAVHSPALLRWAAPRLQRQPRLMDRLLGVTGDMSRPETLLSPGLWWAALAG